MSRVAWLTLLALSCAASVASVRLARPFALDDLPLAVLLLAVVPAGLSSLIALLRRPVGVLVALLMPVAWLYIASRPDDSLLLWAVPLGVGVLMIAMVRAAQERPLPRAVPAAAMALALAAFLMPTPGRPSAGARALILGVEGATWERIDPLITASRLPHLAGLLERGWRARLLSSVTHHPCEVWHTLLDGAGPGDLVLADPCVPEGRRSPPGASFLATLDRATMPRGSADTASAPHGGAAASVTVGTIQDAVRRGARLSTLRRMVVDLLARRGRSGTLDPEQAARTRAWFWDVESDVCAERLRARGAQRPHFVALLLTVGDRAAGLPDALGETFDRALGKLLWAVPSSAEVVVVSIPDVAADGIFLISGPGAERALQAAGLSPGHAAATALTAVEVPAAAATVVAAAGLPPTRSSPGSSIGRQ